MKIRQKTSRHTRPEHRLVSDITSVHEFNGRITLSTWALLLTVLVSAVAGPTSHANAEPNDVTFPDLQKLKQYTTVERGVTLEHMMTSPAALEALKNEQPVPAGTQVVLVDFQSGKLTRYLVMQKATSNAEDPSDWAFQWFWPDGTVKADEDVSRCHSCHQSRSDQQFMFTYDDAVSAKSELLP